MLTQQQLVLCVATLLGAFGGFPAPPKVFNQLAQNELVQWALVFTLLWQGGAGQDTRVALTVTVLAFVVHRFLKSQE